MFDYWLRHTIENLCHSIVFDGCFSKIHYHSMATIGHFWTIHSMVTVKSLTFSRWLKWLKCKCALDGWRKQMESWYFAKWIASARIPEICSLVLQDISDVRRCPWILTRNEWWYTFTLANFRGDEGSGRVGRQGQGLSSHQFCPGSQQSTMAGIQRFNQSVNKEVPFKPNPFPTC